MTHTKRVFLIHGWDGSPHNHWFPWLKRELAENGFAVFAPRMLGGEHPKLSEWLETLKRAVVEPDADTYFVGHSLGCIGILRFLETLSEGSKIGGCVFVAGFAGNIQVPEIAEFYSLPIDIEKARSRSKGFVTIYSDTDQYISISESDDFTQKLHAEGVLLKGRGHFGTGDSADKLSQALDAVLKLAKVKP